MKLSQLSLADYNQLDSIPVINQDLSATDFTPVANTYYKHTGTTTSSYTNGVIYYYNGTGYADLALKTDIPTDIAKIGNLSNPNLLINPNFVINQRGQSEYTNTAKKYTVDRTYSNRSVLTPLQGGGIKLNVLSGQSNPYIQQIIENAMPLVGKTLTLSISIDGVVYSHTVTAVIPSEDSTNVFYNKYMTFGSYTCNLQLVKYKPQSNPYSVLLVTFTIANPNNTIINWWKLEVGSVATEFTPPTIAEELPKCQRYYQRFYQGTGGYGYPMIITGYAVSTTTIVFPIALACSMRNTPTVTYSEIYYRVSGKPDNNLISTVNSPVDYAAKGASVAITVAGASGLTSGQNALLQIRKDGYIAFDAEL